MFSAFPETNFNFSVAFILSSANALNLNQSKILSFGRIKCLTVQKKLWTKTGRGRQFMYISHLLYSLTESKTLRLFHIESIALIDNLTLSQTTNLESSKLKESADNNFKFDENGIKFSEWVENTVRKEEIARYEQFLLFPQFSKDLYCRHVKTRACLGKG